jgi:radical SAM/Cys-rich protein
MEPPEVCFEVRAIASMSPISETDADPRLGQAPIATERFPALRRGPLTTLQVNLGYRCNQACRHCHVGAGPQRTEMMEPANLALVPQVLAARQIGQLDLTGGAPELHPGFRTLVQQARALGVRVMDRCNLTILLQPDQQDLAAFLASESVVVMASLPCYLEANVDRQRGAGTFAASIEGLLQLNSLGYGHSGSNLELNLVYNPQGPSLPPPQKALEEDFRRNLGERYGVVFNSLLTLANMPIERFAASLQLSGELDTYRTMLREHHNPANLDQVMCRQLISVDWRGQLFDCDFNQMLGKRSQGLLVLADLLHCDPAGAAIAVADHCFGCTAGDGSSCGGALA